MEMYNVYRIYMIGSIITFLFLSMVYIATENKNNPCGKREALYIFLSAIFWPHTLVVCLACFVRLFLMSLGKKS